MALNITLTAVNSVIAVLTMPIIVNLSMNYFMAADQALPLQFGKVLQVFLIVLGPVAIGMLVRRMAPGFAARMDKPVKISVGIVPGAGHRAGGDQGLTLSPPMPRKSAWPRWSSIWSAWRWVTGYRV